MTVYVMVAVDVADEADGPLTLRVGAVTSYVKVAEADEADICPS